MKIEVFKNQIADIRKELTARGSQRDMGVCILLGESFGATSDAKGGFRNFAKKFYNTPGFGFSILYWLWRQNSSGEANIKRRISTLDKYEKYCIRKKKYLTW